MSALVISLVAAPLALAALAGWLDASALRVGAIAVGALVLVLAGLLGAAALASGQLNLWGQAVSLDGLGTLVLWTVAFVVFQSSWHSAGYFSGSHRLSLRPLRQYYALWALFSASMLAAPLFTNLALYWVLIELTTLTSSLLVAFDRSPEALEGAWKYVIVVTVGVSLAFAATILLYYAAVPVLGQVFAPDWPSLLAHARAFSPAPVALALVLAVIGYGTKVGLVPMHTWLPDAHAVAPSPVSAMLSGCLLNTAFLGVARFWQIARVTLGPSFPDGLLIFFGLLSLLIAALNLGSQSRLKRLLAYSSVEHMGIIAFALGLSAPYLLGLQMLNHTLVKSSLFFAAGNAVQRFGQRLSELGGLLGRMPFTGFVLLLAGWAVTGAPPLNLFPSELGIAQAALGQGTWLGLLFIALLVLVFALFVGRWSSVIFGPGRAAGEASQDASWLALVPLGVGAALILLFSVVTPGPIQQLLHLLARQLLAVPQ
jgi:hydrogenase-4 component F